jgi:uncharacterized membrane protein YccC
VGRDHRRTDSDSWHLRHELRIHARAGMAIRYAVALGIMAVVCSGLWLGFKRPGWL